MRDDEACRAARGDGGPGRVRWWSARRGAEPSCAAARAGARRSPGGQPRAGADRSSSSADPRRARRPAPQRRHRRRHPRRHHVRHPRGRLRSRPPERQDPDRSPEDARRRRHGRVLLHLRRRALLRAPLVAGGRRREARPRHDRHHLPADRAPPAGSGPRDQRRRHPARQAGREDRGAHGAATRSRTRSTRSATSTASASAT